MKNLTVQALINSQWLDIAELQIMQFNIWIKETSVHAVFHFLYTFWLNMNRKSGLGF